MFAKSKAGVLAVSLCLIGLLCTLGLVSQSSGAAAASRPADSYPLQLIPDQLTLQDDVATVSNTLGHCTQPWMSGVPTGTIILGVNPTSCNPADWSGGSATTEVFLPNIYTRTVVVLRLSWPDRDGKGLHSPERNRLAAITLDGQSVWNMRTRQPGSFGDYYGSEHEPILTTIVLTQSITHTLVISVSPHTAWDLSRIELQAYPYPSLVRGIGYSPYRDCQSADPESQQPSLQELREDMVRLFHTSNAIRTYASTGINGQIPGLANEIGLPIYIGAWLDDTGQDDSETDALIQLADTTHAEGLIIGNEFYLRHRTVTATNYLRQRIQQVRASLQNPHLPLMTAEIDNLMFNYPSDSATVPTGINPIYKPILDEVDVILVHTYPFWNRLPIDGAAAFTVARYKVIQSLIEATYPGQHKRVIIGETGWPSDGSLNGLAMPSLVNQENYLRQFMYLADQQAVEYMYFDAFDELWKVNEGKVGQYWGYSWPDRSAKYNFYGVLLPAAEIFPFRLFLPLVSRQATALAVQPAAVIASLTSKPVLASQPMSFTVYSEWPEALDGDVVRQKYFVPSTAVGDHNNVSMYGCDRSDPHSGEMAIRASFLPTGTLGWGGFSWLYPAKNLGTITNGLPITGANVVKFWAKGQQGGEKVRFAVGGVGAASDPYPESLRPEVSIGPVQLTNQWQPYTIDLVGKDLSSVIRGFGWTADKCGNPAGATFYLDDIAFGYDPAAVTETLPHPFVVYTDAASSQNHYYPTGMMGDTGDIHIDECWPGDAHSGTASIRAKYDAQGQGPSICDTATCNWAGVSWQDPANNWGDRPGGYNLTGARGVTFWAKGAVGGELISFKVGGVGCDTTAPYRDSLCPARALDPAPIYLTNTWQLYTITLSSSLPLTRVVGGFLWSASHEDNPNGATFYLDDIQYLFNTNVSLQSHWIYYGPRLAGGYDMGVNTSGGITNWVTDMGGYMRMAYPPGQSWGAVFITFGPPVPFPRPGQNLYAYNSLSIEMRGEVGGEDVWIGLKDNTDPDNGTETKIPVQDLTTTWQTYTFPLSSFVTADKTRLYVVTEFVFEPGTPAETVYFRRIRYNP
jgi:exo-beta-1,3-glucanase (GH17 family)